MNPGSRLTGWSVRHYKAVTGVVSTVTILVALASALPLLLPDTLPFMHAVRVDTDPENMLSADEPVRIFHDEMKKTLSLYDMVVVGVVDEQNPDGVFNPNSLSKVHKLTEFAKKLTGDSDEGKKAGLKPGEGVIVADIIAPSTVDNIIPAGGEVRFEWLMPQPPETAQAAREVLANAQRIPFFRGTMVPPKDGDAQAVCIYLPITSKNISYKIYRALNGEIARLGGPEKFYVTGLPVAEDTFGVEMFIQMGISAPVAMVIIFGLMLAFFRKLLLVISPMIVALVSVVITMGSLIIAGFPIHIMSSMIPIFIMPIAVLDSIHIISEFFEKYQATRDRSRTISAVMDDLFTPMLYTSLTSAAGFASLALTPIPPVQVFGIFVAAGIMVAWLLTVTFIPAYVMFISPKTLENFGAKHRSGAVGGRRGTLMSRFLGWMGGATYRRAKPILAFSMVVLVVAGWGISRININDNPIKWFTPTHPIREADRVLNRHFGGTYMAYLAMEYAEPPFDAAQYAADLTRRADKRSDDIAAMVEKIAPNAKVAAAESDSFETFFRKLKDRLRPNPDTATDEDLSDWTAVEGFLDRELDRLEFSDPPVDFDKDKTPLALGEIAKAFGGTFEDMISQVKGRSSVIAKGKPESRKAFLDQIETAMDKTSDPSVEKVIDRLKKRISNADRKELEWRPITSNRFEVRMPSGRTMSIPESITTDEGKMPTKNLTGIKTPGPTNILTIDLGEASEAAKAAVLFFLDEERQLHQVFKRPEVLAHMKALAGAMADTGIVGKSNSLVEIVETVNRDLHEGRSEYERIPSNSKAVGSCITQFTSSHRPGDLSHFVTTHDYQTASMWVQLKSGDNKDMSAVAEAVEAHLRDNPPPVDLEHKWFGLTYINVIWQDKMVTGMIEAFAGSFLVVFLLMTILFRSALWGVLSMIPLTVTIAAIYGVVGIVGKDYDMPVAILSSLTLGLAVDFAIHFLARSRSMYASAGSWELAAHGVFGEPARSITRNIIVISAGFLPLLLAPLMPYKTVGVLLATILLVSGAATLLILPAMVRLLAGRLFADKKPVGAACNCVVCIVSSIILVVLIAMAMRQFHFGWGRLTWLAVAIVPILAFLCGVLSRRQKCKAQIEEMDT